MGGAVGGNLREDAGIPAPAAEGNHSHDNKTVLDGITADLVTAWNGKSAIYYSATQPIGLAEGDLWVQLID